MWRALTDPHLLGAWLMPNDIRAGSWTSIYISLSTDSGMGRRRFIAKVLEVETHRRLVYAWRGGSHNQHKRGHELDTVVTWTLTQTAEGGDDAQTPAFRLRSGQFRVQDDGPGMARKEWLLEMRPDYRDDDITLLPSTNSN